MSVLENLKKGIPSLGATIKNVQIPHFTFGRRVSAFCSTAREPYEAVLKICRVRSPVRLSRSKAALWSCAQKVWMPVNMVVALHLCLLVYEEYWSPISSNSGGWMLKVQHWHTSRSVPFSALQVQTSLQDRWRSSCSQVDTRGVS